MIGHVLAFVPACLLASSLYGQTVPARAELLRSADALLGADEFGWSSVDGRDFRVHVQAGAPAGSQVDALRADARAALVDVLALLDRTTSPSFDLFYLASRDDMAELVGARPKALAVPGARLAIFVVNDSVRAHHRHELTHLWVPHYWGAAARPVRWIHEGVAQSVEGTCAGVALDDVAGQLVRDGRRVPVVDLMYAFGAHSPFAAQVLTGSFVDHLRRTHGDEALQRLWRSGARRFPQVMGVPLEQAEAAWIEALGRRPPLGPELMASLAQHGCG